MVRVSVSYNNSSTSAIICKLVSLHCIVKLRRKFSLPYICYVVTRSVVLESRLRKTHTLMSLQNTNSSSAETDYTLTSFPTQFDCIGNK